MENRDERVDEPRHVPNGGAPVPSNGERLSLREYRDAAERAYIVQTLAETDWNISRAASQLATS